ncbi:MAG: EAL domain-containing protein [Methylococcales bacterium]
MLDNPLKTQQPVVLVVDDDMAVRLLIRESLEPIGLTIIDAENGLDALALFEQHRPELVLMDVNMPKMDGFTACAKLRKSPGGEDVAVVLVTGLDDYDSIQRAFDAGATDFITKPVNWPILNHRIRYLLRAGDTLQALRQSESRVSQAQQIARLGNWERDIVNNTAFWSDEIYRIRGLEPQSLTLNSDSHFRSIHPEDLNYVTESINSALEQRHSYRIDYRIVLPDGAERSVHEQAEVLYSSDGKLLSMHGTLQDITERKKAEEQILTLAYYDTLTGLPNRQLFKEHVNRALVDAQKQGTKVALIYLDLDRFKRINDTLGHNAGDELLSQVAEHLSDSVRVTDTIAKLQPNEQSYSSISRLGGDEFTILLAGLTHGKQAGQAASRILEHLSRPINIEGEELYVTGSLGIAVYPDDGTELGTLLKNADIAMYHAKDGGRNSYRFYSEHMNKRMREALAIETKLKKALELDQLILHFQPQINVLTGKVIGIEALVRWQHPDMGLVPPGQFIPVAEESGLILPIGEWVLETACSQLFNWQQAGFAPIRMSVNVSSHQFKQQNFFQSVRRALDTSGLDPRYLELELTETTVMDNVEQTIATLVALKETGLELAIDDFGTGYSSMSYLKQLPLDTLKIDRSFIKDITTDPGDAAIVKAIIALANNFNLTTVAEGVETEEQLTFLREQGCEHAQGFLISRPVSAEKIEQTVLAIHQDFKSG